LDSNVGIDDPYRSSGGPRAAIRRIGEGVIVGPSRTVIGRRGVAVGSGMDGIGGARGDTVVEAWRGVDRRGRVVVTRV